MSIILRILMMTYYYLRVKLKKLVYVKVAWFLEKSYLKKKQFTI